MTTTHPLATGQEPQPTDRPPIRQRWTWRGFSPAQLAVLGLATVAPTVIAATVIAWGLGILNAAAATDLILAAGENPGMITFGAMFLASPIQWLTGRTQVRVRKYLGIVFYLLALSNGTMFAIESGVGDALSRPFLIAGTLALAIATPLFLTSGRWMQRQLGMARWRSLHRLTYVVAAALVAHVVLVGDVGAGFVLISIGAIARVPAIKRRLVAMCRGEQ